MGAKVNRAKGQVAPKARKGSVPAQLELVGATPVGLDAARTARAASKLASARAAEARRRAPPPELAANDTEGDGASGAPAERELVPAPARAPKRRATAEQMAQKQREISISEFFTKNRHLLGFDNPSKALLTTIKEAVDNSLDAC
jgi:DNA topoisomerase-6 subunit B